MHIITLGSEYNIFVLTRHNTITLDSEYNNLHQQDTIQENTTFDNSVYDNSHQRDTISLLLVGHSH